MTNRLMVVLGIALICTGSTLAQTPNGLYSPYQIEGAPPLAPLAATEAPPGNGPSFWVAGDYVFGWFLLGGPLIGRFLIGRFLLRRGLLFWLRFCRLRLILLSELLILFSLLFLSLLPSLGFLLFEFLSVGIGRFNG